MRLGTTHSGQRSPERYRTLPLSISLCGDSANSVHNFYALCVSAFSMNSRLSTVSYGFSAQLPCFHNLPHSSTTAQKSPLCFHNLTNSFSCNLFLLTFIQKHRGYTPLAAELSEPILELRPLIPIASAACPFFRVNSTGCGPGVLRRAEKNADANRKLQVSKSASRSFRKATPLGTWL